MPSSSQVPQSTLLQSSSSSSTQSSLQQPASSASIYQTLFTPSTYDPISNCLQSSTRRTEVLLSTVVIKVKGKHEDVYCKALLDSASQSNFVSERLVQILGIKKTVVNVPVSGLNQSTTHIKYQVSSSISSRTTDYNSSLTFLLCLKFLKFYLRNT